MKEGDFQLTKPQSAQNKNEKELFSICVQGIMNYIEWDCKRRLFCI